MTMTSSSGGAACVGWRKSCSGAAQECAAAARIMAESPKLSMKDKKLFYAVEIGDVDKVTIFKERGQNLEVTS